jgi:hypothetical protein
LSHIIIPREFQREDSRSGSLQMTEYQQDLEALSAALTASGIKHQVGQYALEIKLY